MARSSSVGTGVLVQSVAYFWQEYFPMVFDPFQVKTFCQTNHGKISPWPRQLQVITAQLQHMLFSVWGLLLAK